MWVVLGNLAAQGNAFPDWGSTPWIQTMDQWCCPVCGWLNGAGVCSSAGWCQGPKCKLARWNAIQLGNLLVGPRLARAYAALVPEVVAAYQKAAGDA